MMKVKDLKVYLAGLDPALDEALVVQDSGDHNYCGVGFEVIDAERHASVRGYNAVFLSEYHGDKHMEPGSFKTKVLRVG